jgi:hypothetical protein
MVTGFEEILEVLKNAEDFSAIIGVQGAAAPLPFEPKGSDISAEVEAHRAQFLGGDLLVNYDGQHHTFSARCWRRCLRRLDSRRTSSSWPAWRTSWCAKW